MINGGKEVGTRLWRALNVKPRISHCVLEATWIREWSDYLLQHNKFSLNTVDKTTICSAHRVSVSGIWTWPSRNSWSLLPNVWGLSWKTENWWWLDGQSGTIWRLVYSCICSRCWLPAKSLTVSVCQNTYSWPLQIGWASSYYGGWVPRICVPGEPGDCHAFSNVASKVMQCFMDSVYQSHHKVLPKYRGGGFEFDAGAA